MPKAFLLLRAQAKLCTCAMHVTATWPSTCFRSDSCAIPGVNKHHFGEIENEDLSFCANCIDSWGDMYVGCKCQWRPRDIQH